MNKEAINFIAGIRISSKGKTNPFRPEQIECYHVTI